MSNEKLIPEIRFPEFVQDGEWENDDLGNHCEITTGKLDANAMVENGKYRFYTCAKDYYYIDNYAFDTNALLISGNGAHVGYIHHYNGKFNAYQRTYVLDNFDKDIHFIKFYLERHLKSRIATEKKDGNTPYIVRSTLSEMKILSPINEIEQQKIASCLSSLDDVIAANSQKLELLKDHKKGLMQNLFPQEGETVPKYRFKEFEKDGEWVEKELSDLCFNISSGKDKNSENGEFELYGSTGIIGKTDSASFRGDYILVARVGANAGLLNRAKGIFGVTDNTLVLDLKNVDSTDFIQYNLEKIRLNKLVFGSGQPLITGGQLKSLLLLTPKSEKEQQKIASCLSSLDALITAQLEKIEQLKLHKKGLMQGLFPKLSEL